MNARSKTLLTALAAGLLGALAASVAPWAIPPARAQGTTPPTGRYQITAIRGAVYLVDTQTAQVWVREYLDKRWTSTGNPTVDAR